MGRPANRAISVNECSLPSVNVIRIEVILLVTERPHSDELPATAPTSPHHRAISDQKTLCRPRLPERHAQESIRNTHGYPGCRLGSQGASSGRTLTLAGRILGWSWTGWKPSSRSWIVGG